MKKIWKGLLALTMACISVFSFTACEEEDFYTILDEILGMLGEMTQPVDSDKENSESEESLSGFENSESEESLSGFENSESEESLSGSEDSESEESLSGSEDSESEEKLPVEDIITEELSIHFLELGNKYTGDCTLIKTGDTEILIDAGSRKGSAATIVPYVQKYCTDGVLEYVIATHAHQDHIAGFVGTTKAPGVLESFVCETIIDYPLTNATSAIKEDYEALRDAEVAQGAKHYTALECWNETNGAKRTYELAENITLNILYQRFYEETTSDENDYSVCVMLTQGTKNYLFTGDLEKEGEESLVESNKLPKCELFKGGHHGSPTSNTAALFAKIQPEIVCVCCCCGSDEYTDNVANMFPSQAFVNNVAPYTDRVYVTTIVSDNKDGYESMNGNIVIASDGETVNVVCSNNDLKFKDTAWFKANRILPDAWRD